MSNTILPFNNIKPYFAQLRTFYSILLKIQRRYAFLALIHLRITQFINNILQSLQNDPFKVFQILTILLICKSFILLAIELLTFFIKHAIIPFLNAIHYLIKKINFFMLLMLFVAIKIDYSIFRHNTETIKNALFIKDFIFK